MAIEEYNSGGQVGLILITEEKKKWGWYGFVEVLQFLSSPFIPTKRESPAVVLPVLMSLATPKKHTFAQVVASHGA